MLIDGRAIAREIEERVRAAVAARTQPLSVGIISAGGNAATASYLAIKQKFAARVGITVALYDCGATTTTEEIVAAIQKAENEHDGIIVQLPLSPGANVDIARNAVSWRKDIDVLGDAAFAHFSTAESPAMPPVVGAIAEILTQHACTVRGKRAVVFGKGRLVGIPASTWLMREGAQVTVIDASTQNAREMTLRADIIVLGTGVPGLLTPDMIQNGVVVLDAGTSEAGGVIKGDADIRCAEKAALFTPVPGGIGPITVAVLFENLVKLTSL